MKTPLDKYRTDPEFRMLADQLRSFIGRYTPSEVREAAMMASINYEMECHTPLIDARAEEAFKVLRDITKKPSRAGQ